MEIKKRKDMAKLGRADIEEAIRYWLASKGRLVAGKITFHSDVRAEVELEDAITLQNGGSVEEPIHPKTYQGGDGPEARYKVGDVHPSAETTKMRMADGTTLVRHPDGGEEFHYENGSKLIVGADGSRRFELAPGTVVTAHDFQPAGYGKPFVVVDPSFPKWPFPVKRSGGITPDTLDRNALPQNGNQLPDAKGFPLPPECQP
jgi:hypothetical protein